MAPDSSKNLPSEVLRQELFLETVLFLWLIIEEGLCSSNIEE